MCDSLGLYLLNIGAFSHAASQERSCSRSSTKQKISYNHSDCSSREGSGQ